MDDLRDSFEEFEKSYHNELLKYSMAFTKNNYDAEDVLNESFTRLWNKWEERAGLSEQQNKVWMLTTIQNVFKEMLRQKKRVVLCGDEKLEYLKRDRSIDSFEENLQFQQYVQELKSELDEEEREIFDMAFLQGLPYDKITAKTGIKPSTLRSTIRRMRNKLRKKINF